MTPYGTPTELTFREWMTCLVMAVVFLGIGFLFAWAIPPASARGSCGFREGEIVYTKLDDRKGQILEEKEYTASTAHCTYLIRFAAEKVTKETPIKEQPDDTKSPYSVVLMYEFEITHRKPDNFIVPNPN